MRPFWLIACLFLLIGIGGACRTPDEAPAAGCTRFASGLQHCPESTSP
jgi:hypothetical protein